MNKCASVHIRNIVLWVLAIGYYFVINSFSTAPAEVSKGESQTVVNAVENIANFVQNKAKSESTSWFSGKAFHTIVRKTAHVINFFILSFAHCMLFFVHSNKERTTVLLTLFMGFCGTVLDELTQYFVPGRSAQISDVFVDFMGTILGCIVFFLLYRWTVLKLKRG